MQITRFASGIGPVKRKMLQNASYTPIRSPSVDAISGLSPTPFDPIRPDPVPFIAAPRPKGRHINNRPQRLWPDRKQYKDQIPRPAGPPRVRCCMAVYGNRRDSDDPGLTERLQK
jgi:hypothetical protein